MKVSNDNTIKQGQLYVLVQYHTDENRYRTDRTEPNKTFLCLFLFFLKSFFLIKKTPFCYPSTYNTIRSMRMDQH